jgi:hypothetical protein
MEEGEFIRVIFNYSFSNIFFFINAYYVKWKSTCNTGDYHNEINYLN